MLTGTLAVLAAGVTIAWKAQRSDVLRARALVIVDSLGRERVLLGAPIPEPPGARVSRSTGLVIRDSAGAERFGLGLFPNGRMGMGFDAPPGTGDDRHRERINVVADEQGGASIRFLNRRTGVAGYLLLGDDDNMYLQFHGRTDSANLFRGIGIMGDTSVATPR